MSASVPEFFSGRVLLSHPVMRHDAFRRTVVLVTAHDANGAAGVILNRPLSRTLGEVASGFAGTPLGALPLYEGGPVAPDRMMFSGWHWTVPEGHFKLHFGLNKERVEDMLASDPGIQLRCFAGHAGWSPGQLENELRHNSWAVSPMDSQLVGKLDGEALWRAFLNKHHPTLRLLAEAPDELTSN